MTTLLLVDDEIDMRMLVRIVIEIATNGLSIIGEATDGAEALRVWHDFDAPDPDVVILDNRMPGLTGLEVARRILAERPGQVILLYSAFLNEAVLAEAAAIGITRCVSKQELERLPGIIREVISV